MAFVRASLLVFESSIFIAVKKLYFSMWMSKSGLFCQYEIKSRIRFFRNVKMVGLIGLEPMTPALSRRCSNQLSYRPN